MTDPHNLPHLIDVEPLVPYAANARTHSADQIEQIKASIRQFGFVGVLGYDDKGLAIGHGRRIAALEMWADGETIMGPGKRAALPDGQLPAVDITGLSEADRRALIIADNQLALNSAWDEDILAAEMAALSALDFDMPVLGFDSDEMARLLAGPGDGGDGQGGASGPVLGKMAAEFLIPPFSVLNAREGWWQERKRAWIALGIQSEVGRGENLLKMSDTMLEPDPEKRAAMQADRALAQGMADGAGTSRAMAASPDPSIASPAKVANGKRRGATFGQDMLEGEGKNALLSHLRQSTGEKENPGASGRKPDAIPGGGGTNRRGRGAGGMMPYSADGSARKMPGGLTYGTQDWVNRKIDEGDISGGLSSGRRALGAIPADMPAQYTGKGGDLPAQTGTSIFDPVLCELAYRWFSPKAGLVLDPFAGGSVRGIVAAALGRQYVGIDLRPEQIEANRMQWPRIAAQLDQPRPPADICPPLEVDEFDGIRVVRDDQVTGGTKRRALDRLLASINAQEFVYATPAFGFAQIALAYAARSVGKRATIFVAGRKAMHPRTAAAAEAGAKIVEIDKGGYLTTVQKRAADYCDETGAYLIPFGMDDPMFVEAIADIARELPGPAPAEVWCVAGSGTLTRALQLAWPDAKHHAVQIGRDPDVGAAQLWQAPEKFEEDATAPPPFPSCSNYDAKAWRFIREHAAPGALFWNLGADPEAIIGGPEPIWHVGDSLELLPTLDVEADMIFSCPPYGNLEVYSDDPADISTLDQAGFDKVYADIIAASVARLKPDRFACFIVGDYRDKRGIYANFVSKTIAAFEAAGATLYNEAILVTAVGSLPIRAAKQFRTTRKLGKTHQNILVFVNGDPRKATAALGPVDVSAALKDIEADQNDDGVAD